MRNISKSGASSAIRRALATFLENARSTDAVSARDAIGHVRRSMPALQCSDQHLTDLVAGAVIIADLDVGWDRSGRRAAYGHAHGFEAV